jgi:hypothetical protein
VGQGIESHAQQRKGGGAAPTLALLAWACTAGMVMVRLVSLKLRFTLIPPRMVLVQGSRGVRSSTSKARWKIASRPSHATPDPVNKHTTDIYVRSQDKGSEMVERWPLT